jgi:ubiquinone/menaquinone biosynthesis C-methylase UbiE
VTNIEVKVASVYELPFEDDDFDAVYMLSVIGEIPEPEWALAEFHRVLRSGGTLAFSELLFDPDYPRARTLIRLAEGAGFRLRKKSGNFLSYTIIFEKMQGAFKI